MEKFSIPKLYNTYFLYVHYYLLLPIIHEYYNTYIYVFIILFTGISYVRLFHVHFLLNYHLFARTYYVCNHVHFLCMISFSTGTRVVVVIVIVVEINRKSINIYDPSRRFQQSQVSVICVGK